MRVLACTILTIATVLVAAPARAQTYDPSYPVCLQTYGIDGDKSLSESAFGHGFGGGITSRRYFGR